MSFVFSNNARAILLDELTVAGTSAIIDEDLAERFAVPGVGETQRCIITDDTDNFELVDITNNALTGALTLTRGVESTSARGWSAGSRIEQYFSAAVLTSVALTTALSAISALTPAANKIIRYTSSSAAELLTLTNFGASILDDADEATFKATVNLEIGVDVQAFSSILATFVAAGGLTTAEIQQLQNIDSSAISATKWGYLAAATSFGAAILSGASNAAIRATLGLDTGDSPQFTGINLGHASDTTITRSAAGIIAVEGKDIVDVSSTQTLAGKTLTSPTINLGTSSAGPQLSSETSGTLTIASKNKIVRLNGNVTIPAGVFAANDFVILVGDGSVRTVTQGGGGTQTLAGSATTGNLSLAVSGVAPVLFDSATAWRVGGNVS